MLQIAGDYKLYANFIIKFTTFANRYKYIKKYRICLLKKKVLAFIKKALKVQVIKPAANNFIKQNIIYKQLATNLETAKNIGNIYNNNNFFYIIIQKKDTIDFS